MSRPRKCKICNGDPAITSQIDALIASGVRLKLIAEQVSGFSIYQLSRHKNNCLAVNVATELTPTTGSSEITKWLERAEATYLTAQVDGDTRSAVSAISTAVRSLTQLAKQVEREAAQEKASPDNPNKPATIADLTQLANEFLARRDSENGGVGEKTQSLLLESPEFSQLVLNIWKDRSTLPALLAASDTNYLQREPTTTNATAND